jgi:hypothetical protein
VRGSNIFPHIHFEFKKLHRLCDFYPIIPTGTVKDYLDQQIKLEKHIDNAALIAARKIKNILGKEDGPNDLGSQGSHILGDRYFSMVALRYGKYIAKNFCRFEIRKCNCAT